MSDSPYKNFQDNFGKSIKDVDEYFEKRKMRSEMSTPLIKTSNLSSNDIPGHIDRKSLHFDFVG